uniref:Uncharacterized protein n=1 Tax=Peronospora matthiolae TaxID=2874970 RepID=A0AAV1TEJ6_9STRA
MTESFYHSAADFFSSTTMSEQVMSPNGSSDDNYTAQASPTTSHARAASEPAVVVPSHAHARRADNDALEKVLKLLNGMDERVK